jgi:hypothetical protein
LRQTSSVLYIAVDSLIPLRGNSVPGLDEFSAALDHEGIPAVWLTNRSRLQFDDARRKHGHTHPFIAEDGCAVYLPEDYFHLRPESDASRTKKLATLRLGRFTCISPAQALPAASEALETLSQETGVPVVTLRSLSPRELVQNTGLPQREAELARQRDFDDVFFFAGVSEGEIERFPSLLTQVFRAASATLQSSTTELFATMPIPWPSPQRIKLLDFSPSASAPFSSLSANPNILPRTNRTRHTHGGWACAHPILGNACWKPSQQEARLDWKEIGAFAR